ncbi:MAG: glycerol kinase GlpK, partial [Actinobacteria bacterium]|nr:glycerol kinase GlpK [Actinomycetota bacterium]
DPVEIADKVLDTLGEISSRLAGTVAAIGITNQRETVVAWDRRTGRPLYRALVWQDKRTAQECERLTEAGFSELVRSATGLVIDPYFSATKMSWLLAHGGVSPDPHLALGTVDSWVMWNLTGGTRGGIFATDPSNASRTLLFDIRSQSWSDELTDLFGVPAHALPEIHPSSGRFGALAAGPKELRGVALSGIAGDQQAALFGQACFSPGMAKTTYGTGSFVLMNLGAFCPSPVDGLLTTVAWDLGDNGGTSFALEGAAFVTGAALQWLRDGLKIIERASDTEKLARAVPDSAGVYLVPAFVGLGSPWWDPRARGTITGLTKGVGRAHLARAAVEAMALQNRDIVDLMAQASGQRLAELRVDGGAAVMDLLLEIQADQLRVPVARPHNQECTALGAAMLAGLAEGVWASIDELSCIWSLEKQFLPSLPRSAADALHAGWVGAVKRSFGWAQHAPLL